MTAVRIIGPARIADRAGTHEPGDVLEFPSQALLDLATAGTLNPETGAPYCEFVSATAPLAPPTPPVPPSRPAPPPVVAPVVDSVDTAAPEPEKA